MKDKNLKLSLVLAGAFSAVLAVREGSKINKMLKDTSEERRGHAAEGLKKVGEEWQKEEDNNKG